MRIYGSKVYIYTKDKSTGKWELRVIKGILVGINDHSKGYCYWILSLHKLQITHSVRFDESIILSKLLTQPTTAVHNSPPTGALEIASLTSDAPSTSSTSSPGPHQDDIEEAPIEPPSPQLPIDPASSQYEESIPDIPQPTKQALPRLEPLLRSMISKRPSVLLKDSFVGSLSKYTSTNVEFPFYTNFFDNASTLLSKTCKSPSIDVELHIAKFDLYFGYTHDPTSDTDPSIYEAAIQHRDWRTAIDNEKSALQQKCTWKPYVLPLGSHALTAKWVFKTKWDIVGKILKLKAYLVVRGFQQRCGIDYKEVFVPIAKWNTIRGIIAMVASVSWPLLHLDVVTTFFNDDFIEWVYLQIPHGFESPNINRKVLPLFKSLYSLHQAPRAWFNKINFFLRKLRMQRIEADYSLYFLRDDERIVLLLLYVDDLLLIGSNGLKITWIKEKLMQKFDMSELGFLHIYLGVECIRTNEGVFIIQWAYAASILEEFGMAKCNPSTTPLPEGLKLGKEENAESTDIALYQHLIGKLIYLKNTRTKVMFATSLLIK